MRKLESHLISILKEKKSKGLQIGRTGGLKKTFKCETKTKREAGEPEQEPLVPDCEVLNLVLFLSVFQRPTIAFATESF